jgi:predicted enzyme related to lactoylglutathione lyase
MGNPVVHWEFVSKQPAKIASFYAELFGWTIRHVPELNYRLVETGGQGGINGGIVAPQCEDPWPGNTAVYIAVDDLATYRTRVLAAGGKILVEEQQVPGMGAFSLFADPDGRMMGLWKANQS